MVLSLEPNMSPVEAQVSLGPNRVILRLRACAGRRGGTEGRDALRPRRTRTSAILREPPERFWHLKSASVSPTRSRRRFGRAGKKIRLTPTRAARSQAESVEVETRITLVARLSDIRFSARFQKTRNHSNGL